MMNSCAHTRKHTRHRRGSVYVATLGAATLVTIIGLSALVGARIQTRVADGEINTAKADLCAQSVVDIVLKRVDGDPTWRTTYANDVWTTDETIDDLTFSYKFVDEDDGDLADDRGDSVRLFARASVGAAVRILSVLLQTPAGNILTNGDIENGFTGWEDLGECDLQLYTDTPHSGATYMWIKNRVWYTSGPNQDVTTQITQGTTYWTGVWIRMKDFAETVRVDLVLNTDQGVQYAYFETPSAVGTSWTYVTGTLTPTWTGTLTTATWEARTTTTTQEYKIDDAFFIEAALTPVAGTWRREIMP